jgi:zinc protease
MLSRLEDGGRLPPVFPSALLALSLAGSLELETLENGLVVGLDPTPGAATVAVAVGYRVGAAHVPPGRHGLAHLVEHLLFRRAGRLGEFRGTDHVERVGGIFNGTTWPHRTVYWSVVPPEALRRTLVFERERMGFSRDAITAHDLELEQKIVNRELEYREGFARRLRRKMLAAFFHPGHPWVGSEKEGAEVNRHTLEEARWLIERYYRPDRAVLVVSGAFDPRATLDAVRAELGTLPRGRSEIAPADWGRPQLRRVRGVEVRSRDKVEGLSRVYMAPQGTPMATREVTALLLDMALEDFEKAHRDRVHDTSADLDRQGFIELLSLDVRGKASRRLEGLEAALETAVKRMLDVEDRFSRGNLRHAKKEVELSLRRTHDEPRGRALAAVHALLDGEPPSLERKLAELEGVTLGDVQEAVRRLLTTEPFVVRRVRRDGDFEMKAILEEGEI